MVPLFLRVILPSKRDNTSCFPPTHEQIEDRNNDFIESIDKDAICSLASQYNNQAPCRIFDSNNGSFNICFFLDFYTVNTKCVVRIPIEPALYDAWEKLQREVATMEYIQRKTNIPIPKIIAYGREGKLTKNGQTTQPFLILDYVPGRPLDKQTLLKGNKERRQSFYAELLEIFAQLRDLEFPRAGSLKPAPDNRQEPVVGGLATVATNELQNNGTELGHLYPFTSTTGFVQHLYRVLSEIYRLPEDDLSRSDAELQMFALNSIKELTPKLIDSRWDKGPFVLTHLDLRCGNIIVDDALHIQGVIDWEWAGTVPRHMFIPPSWITGQDHDHRPRIMGIDVLSEFCDVLQTRSQSSSRYDTLVEDWDFQQKLTLPLAHILYHPSDLRRSYFKFIYPSLFNEPREKVLGEFFSNGRRAREVQRRLDESERYTQYLKNNDLFIPDPKAQENLDWLSQAKALNQELGLYL